MSEPFSESPHWVGLWWADSIWASHTPPDHGEASPLVANVRSVVQAHRSNQFSLLETVRLLTDLREATDRVLHEVIAQARSENYKHSWKQIGDALGVGRTAAQKRFGSGLSEEHLDYLEYELKYAIGRLHEEIKDFKEEAAANGYTLTAEDAEYIGSLMDKIAILENRFPSDWEQVGFDELTD
ncbi:hypothetical protein ACFVZE_34830 [Streptomyces anulatus]|uniref:hypothetical protein n=1 Tax=Streptomyces anulatus TaxID=1892 RepID=UPI0036DB73CA